MSLLVDVIQELRPKQWYKNILLFIGLIFSFQIGYLELWIDAILGFVIFCILSGSMYLINDIVDCKEDRLHPTKKNRPIASGRLDHRHAFAIALTLIFIAVFGSMHLGLRFAIVAAIYVFVTLSYNFLLKKIYLVDVFTISFGFVLRAVAGCVAIGVMISPWLILCAFLMALFLAFAKRRHELIVMGNDASKHRHILEFYSVSVLDSLLTISMASLIVSYSIYTFLSEHPYMMLTIPFVLYGLFRYLDKVYNSKLGGEPEMIFKDPAMIADMSLWLVVVLTVLIGLPDTLLSII